MNGEGWTRRQAAAAIAGAPLATTMKREVPALPTKDRGFLWGTAISAYQSEGNNVGTDCWLLENLTPSGFTDPSLDACDSYHRYADDLDIAQGLGLNTYRFGIEWARIEPEPGRFSDAALDHYVRVLEGCHARGLLPVVTFNHFTVPLWFAMRGGFEVTDGADLFARFAARATERLGPLIGMASTFNEANIVLLRKILPRFATEQAAANARAMIAEAKRRTASPAFSSVLFGDPERITEVMLDAHDKAVQAMRAGPGTFPVGVTLSMQQMEGVGPDNRGATMERALYGGWIDAARRGDYIGVQTYSRLRFDDKGLMRPPAGAELTDAGYEYFPSAVGYCIRYAHEHIGVPIYLTETGIATERDGRRIDFIDATVAEVRACRAEGIDVRGYLYWSLLDNFEWTAGYDKHFGLVAVDRTSFARTMKPSARHLGMLARKGLP